MSDQGMFQRNINSDGAASQSFSAGGDIDSTTSVAYADTSGGSYTIVLPDQLASAGMKILVVSVDGAQNLTIGVQSSDALNGTSGGVIIIAFGTPYSTLSFASTGDSWVSF